MATVNYLYPVAGSAPSTHASQTSNIVTAQLVMTDLDTTATITHNFVSSTIYPPNTATDLASGFPIPAIFYTTAPTTSVAVNLTWTVGTNTVTVAKTAAVGSAFTGLVSIPRPATITR